MLAGLGSLQSIFTGHWYTTIPSTETDIISNDGTAIDAEKSCPDSWLNLHVARGEQYTHHNARAWLPDPIARILCFSVLLAGIIMFNVGLRWRLNSNRLCWEKHTSHSPAVAQSNLAYHEVQFNGSLGFPSPYRGPPEPGVDEAWEGLLDIKLMSLSEKEMRDMHLSLDSVRIPEQFGGGYFATLEFPHQIHCLNMLRKSLNHNWAYYEPLTPELRESPQTVHKHLDHCIEMLRQNLMCNVDPGFVTYHWVEGWPKPYPNFNTRHMCRDRDSYSQWARAREVPIPPSTYDWKPLEGEHIWPTYP